MKNKWIIITITSSLIIIATLGFAGGYFLSRNSNQTNTDMNNQILSPDPAITLNQAKQIAYNDLTNRNIQADFYANSGQNLHRGQLVWELEFRLQNDRSIIEYYINVADGSIVKFEWEQD